MALRSIPGVLLIVCTCFGYSEASQSSWDRAKLPEPLRTIAHLTSAEVPPFPIEDPSFLDPLQWPDSMMFLDRRYHLNVSANQSDVATTGGKEAIRPGWAVQVGYSSPWKISPLGVHFDLPAGPSYMWNEYGRLYRQTWYEPDSVTYHSVSYTTYPSGALLAYEVAEREADPLIAQHLMKLKEYFGSDGKLVGLSHTMAGRSGQYWWRGRSVSEKEWDEKSRKLQQKVYEEEGRKQK